MPNLKLHLLEYYVADVEGNVVLKRVARPINRAALRPLTDAKFAGRDIYRLVQYGVEEAVRSGRMAIQLDIIEHPRGGEPFALADQDFYHGTINHNLEDGFIEDGKFAGGQRFKCVETYLPLSMVDVTAHAADIANGMEARDIVEGELYMNQEPETLVMANLLFK